MTSGSTGSGCRRGVLTRSLTRAGSSCAPSALTSDSAPAKAPLAGVTRAGAMNTQQTIEVVPERLERWCQGFGDRHGGVTSTNKSAHRWTLLAGDGVRARIEPAFPPVEVDAGESVGLDIGDLVEHVLAERTVGVLLVRLGAHAAGVFEGSQLVSSKVGRSLVHGRSKAGGWSQQRFARRRAGQARESLADAAAIAARILLPEVARL